MSDKEFYAAVLQQKQQEIKLLKQQQFVDLQELRKKQQAAQFAELMLRN